MAQVAPSTSKSKKSVAEKQNVKVVVRPRPLNRAEIEINVKTIIKYLGNKDILAKEKRFQFDRVFKTEATQLDVYLDVVAPMIPDLLSGYNCTVFAYGQTGSGKTYTMSGSCCEVVVDWEHDVDAGIIPRAASHIYSMIPTDGPTKSVKVSYLELYNEEIRDLLSIDDIPLNIYNDNKGSILVQGLTEVNVFDNASICKLLQKGNVKRQTAPTLMNHHSSRSHTVFTITIFTTESDADNGDVVKIGKINFVDLAGSENIARSGCKELRAVELANINKSLLTLGRVIHALADKGKRHVPYRDSKLTRILQDSLGGHTKTCIIATISTAITSSEETLSTLEYACRARDIKNSPTVNEKVDQAEMIAGLRNIIKKMELDLIANRNGVGFFISQESYSALMEEVDTLRGFKLSLSETMEEKEKVIQELRAQLNNKDKEYELSLAEHQKSRELLDQLQLDIKKKRLSLKRERFVSQTYEQDLTFLHSEAEDLLITSETLSEQTNILQTKLEKLYHINKMNEMFAQDAIANVLEVMTEVFDEADKVTAMNKEMSGLCQEDIREFKLALQLPLENLNRVFANFDRSMLQHIPIKDTIVSLMNKFVFLMKIKISEIKSNCTDFSVAEKKLVAQMPKDINTVFDKFQLAVSDMVHKVTDLLEQDDAEINDLIDDMSQDILIRREEEDRFYRMRREMDEKLSKQLGILKNKLGDSGDRRGGRFLAAFKEIEDQSRGEMQRITDKFVQDYEKLNSLTVTSGSVDALLTESVKFSKNMDVEVTKMENMQIAICSQAGAILKKAIEVTLQEMTTAVSTNYDSLSSRFSIIASDRVQEQVIFKELMAKIGDVLTEDLIRKLIVVKHEGDTPARQPGVKRTLESIASREVLLQKFSALKEEDEQSTSTLDTGDEDKDTKNDDE